VTNIPQFESNVLFFRCPSKSSNTTRGMAWGL